MWMLIHMLIFLFLFSNWINIIDAVINLKTLATYKKVHLND